MTLLTLKNKLRKGNGLLQTLLLVVTILSFTACAEDDTERFFFDEEAQKVKDEEAIRKYFRDNNVDTTAVVRTQSGLYYLEVTEGEGEEIQLNDTVEAHYIGRFINNLIFDSSYNRGKAYTFVVRESTLTEQGVIKGWAEGLPLMRVGGEGFLYVPSHLAYGPYPDPSSSIPPNAVLVFNIEVLSKK
ncbi:FKBP-type peptidyl-prolyl cis-trans isomerase [Pontibacter populi]|uniref:Peptidyl-prolyl cis-trans isomerase n=1 Tax=Pontibacter populi TaxID=890055 RepID=A0ABV1RXI7_9BACT